MKITSFRRFLLPAMAGLAILVAGCAKQGAPTGGPKDTEPPVALSQNPPNKTVRFTATKITLTFNEFVQLKDPAKEIFISPPMRIKPEYKASGKNIVIQFKEPLKPDATYTINFGKAIADFTEANPLTNYEYVFATGDKLDSLSVSGKVLNAFNLQPEPDLVAMVFTNDNDTLPIDSLPLKVPPKSASRTLKDGTFRINNLPPGDYLLFALQDLNNNFIFDLPNEKIAFLDSLVSIVPPVKADTNQTADSLTAILPVEEYDTVSLPDSLAPWLPAAGLDLEKQYTLYLFEETSNVQRMLGKKLAGENLITYLFRLPLDSFHISLVDHEPQRPDWYLPEVSKRADTVNLWLRPGLPDTIRVRFFAGDTLADTSRFILAKATDRPGRKKDDAGSPLKIFPNTAAGALDLNKELRLIFSAPIETWDTTRIILTTPQDTLNPTVIFTDTLQRTGIISYKFQPGDACRIIISDSAFTDISGHANDSTGYAFKIRKPEEYGLLIMNLIFPEEEQDYIIQLMTEKEFILSEQVISGSQLIRFENLRPGKYKLKATRDKNRNGRWDTGRYKTGLLPEAVGYYTLPIDIRANWELQEEWKVVVP